MPQKIVLVSCVSKKGDRRDKAKNLYRGPLFNSSIEYAYRQKPDKIFILSALHGIVELDQFIEPYDVTLSKVPTNKRKPGLVVLTASERIEWGKRVTKQLLAQTDLTNDEFIILAGELYIKPIRENIKNIQRPLKGKKYGQRVKFLNEN